MTRSRSIPAALALALAALLSTPARAEETRPSAPAPAPRLEPVYLEVSASGEGAEKAIASAEAALRGVAGVEKLEWTAPGKEVRLERREGTAPDADLVKAAAGAGVTAARVPVAQVDFVFEKALHCNGCAAKVKRALKKLGGTKDVTIRADKTGVAVVYDTRTGKVDAMRQALKDVGYPAKA